MDPACIIDGDECKSKIGYLEPLLQVHDLHSQASWKNLSIPRLVPAPGGHPDATTA
jgi:hypothetical protein